MTFEFEGSCQHCGSLIYFILDADHKREIRYAAKCHTCLNSVSEADCERLYHLMDTIRTVNQRNGLVNLTHILIHNDR